MFIPLAPVAETKAQLRSSSVPGGREGVQDKGQGQAKGVCGNPGAQGKSPVAENSSARMRKIVYQTPADPAPGPKFRTDENGNGWIGAGRGVLLLFGLDGFFFGTMEERWQGSH